MANNGKIENLIRPWRDLYGMTQVELAQAVGIHPKALSRIENGAEPSLTNALNICKALSQFSQVEREAAAALREDQLRRSVQRFGIPKAFAARLLEIIQTLSPREIGLEHIFYLGEDPELEEAHNALAREHKDAAWRAWSRADDDLARLRDRA